MHIDLTFHSIGQGLFYSGKIDSFDFIIDCGSKNTRHLKSMIEEYLANKLGKEELDLLILSHLHDDHISGLDFLFESGVKVNQVVLPYLSPLERLTIALRRINLQPWFYDFLADPITFLLRKEVKEVILVGGVEPYPPENRRGGKEPTNMTDRGMSFELPEDDRLKKEVLEGDEQLAQFFEQKRVFARNHNGYAVLDQRWLFRLFNCRVDSARLQAFERCVKSIVPIDTLISAISSKPLLRRLRNCYRKLGGDFNNTSLSVYHAPIIDRFAVNLHCDQNLDGISVYPNCRPTRLRFHLSAIEGHLLMGDINLKSKLTQIQKHYGHHLSRLSLALVPHHGADRYWDSTILDKTDSGCDWIVSSGVSNTYEHPSLSIVQDIKRKGRTLYYCNEVNEIRVT